MARRERGSALQQSLTEAETSVLAAMRDVIDAYTRMHSAIRESQPEVANGEETIEAATWELSGRCISLANAWLLLLTDGYVVQSDLMQRALLETSSLLAAIASPEEQALRTRWLADQNVPFSAAMRATERLERRFVELGVMTTPPADERMRALSERSYRYLSRGIHSQRSKVRQSVLPVGFAYTTECQWLDRSVTILFAGGLLATMIAAGLSRGLSVTAGPDAYASVRGLSKTLLQRVGELSRAMQEKLDESIPGADEGRSSNA